MDAETSDEINAIASYQDTAAGKLKARFLDRFAEIVSYERGAEHVSCTMLRESGDSVEIWVSRNSGVGGTADTAFLKDFSRVMEQVADSVGTDSESQIQVAVTSN